MKHILILEDDYTYRKMLSEKLSKYGRVFEASTLEAACKIFEAGHLDVAFVDLDLEQKLDGIKFLERCSSVESIVLSSHDEEAVIESCYRKGAKLFLNKWTFEEQAEEIFSELFRKEKNEEIYRTKNVELNKRVSEAVRLFRKTKLPLLLIGETGVGKGNFAKSLGEGKPLVHVNLSEFSRGTIESELFGHVKGAFTGALNDKVGLFKKANGGILFLDEIGTLTIELQKKLLRVIEEGIFYPVGSSSVEKSNFRLLTATCDDLEEMIEKGEFRKDFYFRISGLKLELPPLRERREDIESFLLAKKSVGPKKYFFKQGAMESILSHSWKGNYRELTSFIDKLLSISQGVITKQTVDNLLEKEKSKQLFFFNNEMKTFVKQNGLGGLINSIEEEALLWAKSQTGERLNESIRLLKVSKSLFYRIQKKLISPVEA